MDIRRCGHTHLIRAIRGGLVIKVHNINSYGRRALSFKTLKDVFERLDAKISSCNTQARLPMADRTLQEIEIEAEEFVARPDGSDNDLDDDTTLSQLKDRFVKMKRTSDRSDEHFNLACADENSVEDKPGLDLPMIDEIKSENDEYAPHSDNCSDSDSDSDTTLKQLKERFREKKRKFGVDFAVEDESDLNEPIICLKLKNSRTAKAKRKCTERTIKCEHNLIFKCPQKVEESESPRKTYFPDDDSSFCNDEVRCPGGEVLNVIGFKKPIFSAEECQNCVTNEISYDHLEDIEPVDVVFVPSEGMNDKVETTELNGLLVDSNMVQFEDNISSSFENYVTSLENDDITRALDDETENSLNCEININDELVKTREVQASLSSITVSKTDPCKPPERLLSMRKAISPSSQERLCSAMNSVELCNDDDDDDQTGSKPEGQLCEGETWNKALSAGSDIEHAEIAVSRRGHAQVSLRKVHTSSRHIIKKTHNTKTNLEAPRFSRALARLSTECTSIRGCSESAIAFSQRQMQDMESLAFKLMDELESMKRIVEQKLLFEAYRCVPLKSDADEVKTAIVSASKLEKTARKWLSTMARDCKRFCKIMKMTPNSSPASTDPVPRDKRKIVFADEAGGKLCHVKIFESGGGVRLVSDGVEQ